MSEDDKEPLVTDEEQKFIDKLFADSADVPDEDDPAQNHYLLANMAISMLTSRAKGEEINPDFLSELAKIALKQGKALQEQQAQIEHLKDIAFIDDVSGLYNKKGFNDHVQTELNRQSRNEDTEVAVFFLDLNNFKPINDNLGHEEGDAALKLVAEKLTEILRETDTVARYGGDEFTILVTAPKGHREHFDTVEKKLHDLLINNKINYKGYDIGSAIGKAISGEHPHVKHETVDSLIKRADLAMYENKRAQKEGTLESDRQDLQTAPEENWALRLGRHIGLDKVVPSLYNPDQRTIVSSVPVA